MNETLEKVIEILTDLHEDVDFATAEKLWDSHILDSFDVVTLVAELNNEFDIVIGADKMTPENFNSAQALAALVEELSEI